MGRRHPTQRRKLRTGTARWTPEQIYVANGWFNEPSPTAIADDYIETALDNLDAGDLETARRYLDELRAHLAQHPDLPDLAGPLERLIAQVADAAAPEELDYTPDPLWVRKERLENPR